MQKMPINPMNLSISKPKCPSCGTPLYEGITTRVDEKTNSEICNVCKAVLGKK